MVKLLDLQAITMQHSGEYKEAVNRVIESGWFLQGNENKNSRLITLTISVSTNVLL